MQGLLSIFVLKCVVSAWKYDVVGALHPVGG